MVSLLSAQQDPTPDEILQRFENAIGGEEALRSIESLTITFDEKLHTESDGRKQTTESTSTLYSAGTRWVIVNSRGSKTGFDGARYWTQNKRGAVQWNDGFRYPLQNIDPIFYPLHLSSFPGKLSYAGTESINGTRVHKVKTTLTHPEPELRIQMAPLELFFGVEDGLLVRVVHERKIVDFKNYSDVNGFMVARDIESTTDLDFMTARGHRTITSVDLDVDIDDSIFSPEKSP